MAKFMMKLLSLIYMTADFNAIDRHKMYGEIIY